MLLILRPGRDRNIATLPQAKAKAKAGLRTCFRGVYGFLLGQQNPKPLKIAWTPTTQPRSFGAPPGIPLCPACPLAWRAAVQLSLQIAPEGPREVWGNVRGCRALRGPSTDATDDFIRNVVPHSREAAMSLKRRIQGILSGTLYKRASLLDDSPSSCCAPGEETGRLSATCSRAGRSGVASILTPQRTQLQ